MNVTTRPAPVRAAIPARAAAAPAAAPPPVRRPVAAKAAKAAKKPPIATIAGSVLGALGGAVGGFATIMFTSPNGVTGLSIGLAAAAFALIAGGGFGLGRLVDRR